MEIHDALAEVRATIADASRRSGRDADSVTLVAVSKTHTVDSVREALECGQTIFGESRVQEARQKIPLAPGAARWHFIGHLQKNKIRHALPLFELLHSVDSVELAGGIDRVAAEIGLFPRVLLEVNVAGESSKHGFPPDALRTAIDELLGLGRLQIEGLMTIAPFSAEPEDSRRHFAALRDLRDDLEKEVGIPLPELSMGMSGDFPVAIEEGATLVRVGSAIFGERPSPRKKERE